MRGCKYNFLSVDALTKFSSSSCSYVMIFPFIPRQECSINSPDYGPMPPDAPSWCQAPFDPEGLLRCACYLIWLLINVILDMFVKGK